MKLLNGLESPSYGNGLHHLKKGDAANYANYQQGVTFWSISVSVRDRFGTAQ